MRSPRSTTRVLGARGVVETSVLPNDMAVSVRVVNAGGVVAAT